MSYEDEDEDGDDKRCFWCLKIFYLLISKHILVFCARLHSISGVEISYAAAKACFEGLSSGSWNYVNHFGFNSN